MKTTSKALQSGFYAPPLSGHSFRYGLPIAVQSLSLFNHFNGCINISVCLRSRCTSCLSICVAAPSQHTYIAYEVFATCKTSHHITSPPDTTKTTKRLSKIVPRCRICTRGGDAAVFPSQAMTRTKSRVRHSIRLARQGKAGFTIVVHRGK